MTTQHGGRGPLVIIGGAEDRRQTGKVIGEFVRLAGGRASRVVVISAAADDPARVAAAYVELFRTHGAAEVRALDIRTRADAGRASALAAVEEASGVFFTGGTQLRITRLLGGTRLERALHRRHEEGLVIAGTSAGAAMMSSVMIVGGGPPRSTALRVGMVELGPGLEFLPGVLIDQHFEERGRLRRLLSAVVQNPHELGLGIDENTAAVVRDSQLEVVGEGSVTIIDAGDMTYTNLDRVERHELLAVSGVRVHVLPAGYRFDLLNRAPLLPPD